MTAQQWPPPNQPTCTACGNRPALDGHARGCAWVRGVRDRARARVEAHAERTRTAEHHDPIDAIREALR